MVTDDDIKEYGDSYWMEEGLRFHENEILRILKYRQETYPSDKHNVEWLQFSNYCIARNSENKFSVETKGGVW